MTNNSSQLFYLTPTEVLRSHQLQRDDFSFYQIKKSFAAQRNQFLIGQIGKQFPAFGSVSHRELM